MHDLMLYLRVHNVAAANETFHFRSVNRFAHRPRLRAVKQNGERV